MRWRRSCAALLHGRGHRGGGLRPARSRASQTDPPRVFERSAKDVIAHRRARLEGARGAHATGRSPPPRTRSGVGRWQVSFFRGDKEVVAGRRWTTAPAPCSSSGPATRWPGGWRAATPGAFGRKLNAPYVWLPLVPAVPRARSSTSRRPFRLLHLDLLVLLVASAVSHVFFNRGEIGISVPLVYPVLLYLLARMLVAGFRPRGRGRGPARAARADRAAGRRRWCSWSAFRVALNMVDSNVIDVGYAGVIGADRIVDGDPLYGDGFSAGRRARRHLRAGELPASTCRSSRRCPWSGRWDDLPAAHGAAIAFDLLTLRGLLLLGRRLRAGPEGRMLGVALAYAWAAYPYTLFALETNSNDTLVARACAGRCWR